MSQTDTSVYKFFNFYIPTYAYGCWPSHTHWKVFGYEGSDTGTYLYMWHCGRVTDYSASLPQGKLQKPKEGLPLTQHTATFHRDSTQLLWTAEHVVSHGGVAQRRLLAVCIAPTAGGEEKLSLCFTFWASYSWKYHSAKLTFHIYHRFAHYRFLCFYRVVSLFHKTLRTIQVYGIK